MKARIKYLRSRIRRSPYAGLIAFAGKLVLFIAGSLLIGVTTAWYMVEKGSPLTTDKRGPWSMWFESGSLNADPYTLAHMARSGRLPITSSNALYFMAETDSDGDVLATDCDYEINGKPLDAGWWSLALYDRNGNILGKEMDNMAYANSSSVLRLADGGFVINLAREVRPGNWIRIDGDSYFTIMLRLYGIHASKDTRRAGAIEQNLPTIKRLDCR